jgi:hypothetical protein
MRKNFIFLTVILAIVFATGSVWAANVVIPNVFTPNTPAHADSVNENFSSLAVDIDEYSPAVKETSMSGFLPITDTVANLTTITVTPPRDGFIILTAQGSFEFDQLSAAGIQAYVYLTDVSGTTSTEGTAHGGFSNTGFAVDFLYFLTSIHASRVFAVTGGVSKTFYLTGRETVGSATCNTFVKAKLTALYVPNALP